MASKRRILYPSLQAPIGTPRIVERVGIDKWLEPLSIPTRRKSQISTTAGAVIPPLGFAWNPQDKDSGTVLSNGNRTASGSGSGTAVNQFARVTLPYSTGKYYWTVTLDAQAAAGNVLIGIANASYTNANYLGNTTNAVGAVDAGFLDYNTLHVTAPAFAVGQTVGIAVDFGAGLLWLENVTTNPGIWNDGTGNPATGFNGFDFASAHPITGPWYGAVSLFQAGDSVTLFEVAHAPPTGFTLLGGQTVAPVVETITVDKWLEPFSMPRRPLPRRQTTGLTLVSISASSPSVSASLSALLKKTVTSTSALGAVLTGGSVTATSTLDAVLQSTVAKTALLSAFLYVPVNVPANRTVNITDKNL